MHISAPNFLENLDNKYTWAFFVIIAILLAGIIFFVSPTAAAGIILLAVLLFFALRPHVALYALVVVGFFHEWTIDFSRYVWARDIPYLSSVSAPFVDIVAILLLLSILIAWWLSVIRVGDLWCAFKESLGGWYSVFLLSGLVALFLSPTYPPSMIKYLLRPMLFAYICFAWLPVLLIDTKNTLIRVLHIWWWLGLAMSVFGFISLFVTTAGRGWHGAVPFAIGNFVPLGTNHNSLAEPLVAIVPVAVYMVFFAQKKWRQWYLAGTLFIIAITLLTLSRAAWIAVGAELIIFFLSYRREALHWVKQQNKHFFIGIVAVFVLIVGYMGFFLNSHVVSSSDTSRVAMNDIAFFLFERHPWFGYGPGQFIEQLGQTYVFTINFGAPLDAHGFLQKIGVEEGIFGLITFCLFLGLVLWRVYRARHEVDTVRLIELLFLMVLGAIIFQLFDTSYFIANMWLPIGVSLAGVRVLRTR